MTTEARRTEVEEMEIEFLLEGVYRLYGYDFRQYAPASVRRRIRNLLVSMNLEGICRLREEVLSNRECFDRFVAALTVNVTAMYRDPEFYAEIRRSVVPILRTYPFIRIWHAGCSTGEEVYSTAILLQEEGLYERCRIYATDLNEEAIDSARAGTYSLKHMKEYSQNYFKAGGTSSLSDYYSVEYNSAIFRSSLRKNIVFSQHDLVTGGSFNEFNLILCRNVLIYFNTQLQDQVHDLIYGSLGMFGILGLGIKESVAFTSHEKDYEALSSDLRLYRKVN